MRVMIAVPSYGKVSTTWAQNFMSIQTPLGVVSMHHFDARPNIDIAEKRNFAIQNAIDNEADVLFFVGDDVWVPAETLQRLLNRWKRGDKIVTGVYWTKSIEPEPYIFRDYMAGSFLDWRCGDYFPVDWAGCDCLLIDIALMKRIGSPWFSRDYTMATEGVLDIDDPRLHAMRDALNTEDLFFYSKLKKHDVIVMCDSAIQCRHEDRRTGALYGVCDGMPQMRARDLPPNEIKGLLIAEIGAGNTINPMYQDNTIERFDADESCHPDYVCDVRELPVDSERYDIANASHVLEHLPFAETISALREWFRVIKIGGMLLVRVPNIARAFERITMNQLHHDARWATPYEFLMIYGSQENQWMFHKSGFTESFLLQNAQAAIGDRGDVTVELNPEDQDELMLKIIKRKSHLHLEVVAEPFRKDAPIAPDVASSNEAASAADPLT